MPTSPSIASLVREALALPPESRAAWLESRCRDDAALLQSALRVLHAQAQYTLVNEASASTSPPLEPAELSSLHPADPALPERLGTYRILRLLGEGGMGVVYLAEQERPRRTVALKVIRPGLLTPRALRRFDQETQTLARLQHPGIAQVFEAGWLDPATPGGVRQPYFAMEFVDGLSLTDHAAARRLVTAAKLALFARVCHAVQHAHQRGVIHRDLKPSNIIITPEGEPKVLDFGVAKFTGDDGDAQAMRTEAQQIVGTVPYMSPEQIAGAPDEVDTRSDVYTLGVILYELLTGELPHHLSGRTIVEASRIITTQQTPKLGLRAPEFRGDLETIVSKALQKDRQARYQSPADLAEDLGRFLRSEPIRARPPSTVYLIRKFAARNRPLVIAGAASVMLAILGAVGVTWQAVEATRGRQLAEAMRRSADEAKQAAINQAATATQINDLLTQMLQSADPDISLGREVTVREVLDSAAAGLDDSVHDARVLATMHATLAGTYQNLNRLAEADKHARASLELFKRELGDEAPETLIALQSVSNVLADSGRFTDAETPAREALDRSRRRYGRGAAETVGPLITLSRVLHEAGRIADATSVLDEALEVATSTLGPDHRDTLYAMHNKASALKDEGKFAEAIDMFRIVIERRRRTLGASHTQTLSSMNNLAATLQKAGRNQEALDLLNELYEVRRRILGPDHAATLTALSNIAVCHIALKQLDQAEPPLRQAIEGYKRVAGPEHNKTLISMANLAYLEEDRGHIAEAEKLYREVIAIRLRGQDPNQPELLSVMNNLAMLLQNQGDLDAAATVFADLTQRAQTALPPGNYVAAIFANNYGECLLKLNRLAEAEPLLTESLAVLMQTLGDAHPRTEKARARLEALNRLKTPPMNPAP